MLASSSVLRLPVTTTCLCVMGMQRWPRVAVTPPWGLHGMPGPCPAAMSLLGKGAGSAWLLLVWSQTG